MSESWRAVLDEFDIETTATDAPADRDGDWFQILGVFGTAGFLRLLTDGEALVMQLAPPDGVDRFVARVEDVGWEALSEGPPALFERPFPDEDLFRDLWITIARLGDAIRDDDGDDFLSTLEGATSPPEAGDASSGDSAAADEDDAAADADEQTTGDDETGDDESGDDAESADDRPAGAFEPIGGDEAREPLDDGGFEWTFEGADDGLSVVLGFGSVLEADDYQRLEDRLVRNLRGKYDVDVEIDDDHSIELRLRREPGTRVALHVVPDRGVSRATASDVEGYLDEYFGNLGQLASSGIDPLVFLGVTPSKRAPGGAKSSGSAFETIGADDDRGEDRRRDEPSSGRAQLVVDDEPEGEDDSEGTGVVFGATSEPDQDDPLEPGRFDDPRLRGPDATTSLVDVVLRHPGYSDRRVGQVLSILLSIEYSDSLELMNNAPTVIAWGVARDRGQTMKTVIEGAGGKVYLAEPGQFHDE